MTHSQYLILKYLDEYQGPVDFDNFPNEITSEYSYGIRQDSLRHELEIRLNNIGWVKTPGYPHGPYSITLKGKEAFYKEAIIIDNQTLKMNSKLKDARNSILLYLADFTHRNSYSNFETICEKLNTPEECKLWISNHLFRNGLVSGPTSARTSEMIITQKGLEEVDQIENEYFISTSRPLNPKNTIVMSIPEACEHLFQMHKENRYKVEWTKSTYNNAPENLDAAKDLMLMQNVLKEGRDWQETKLNPELFDIDSYEEAKNILLSKSNQPGGSIHNYHVQQAGAVGPHAVAHDNNFNQIIQQLPFDTDYTELEHKLRELRKAIASEAEHNDQYIALGELKNAEVASSEKNASKVVVSLKAAGKWIFDKGIDVGKEVLVAYIKNATGI